MAKRTLSIEAINERLKAAKIGVAVLQRGDRLSLRATLPPRLGSGKTKASQQTIGLGIYANPAGLATAEAKALELGSLLAQNRFDWARWEAQEADLSCRFWLDRYHAHYLQKHRDHDNAEAKWHDREWLYLQHLPDAKPLEASVILKAVRRHPESSRSRQLACQALARFAKFAAVEVDLTPHMGSYRPRRRELPTDEQIASAIEAIPNPQWQTIAALMACYGLRDHEAHLCSIRTVGETLIVHVPPECKTEERDVRPLYPEWANRWIQLPLDRPAINAKRLKDYGERTARAFKRYAIGFTPYDLRHAYAIRASVVFKLPIAVAAAWMGHSPAVHWSIYNKWITADQHQAVFDEMMSRSDRPLPPQ